ncbi:Protein of unknown function [Lactobacillus bombicola]|uniref:DUF3397 domain-containing protein n=1 Tax=Lactobacillus bombicola TaxID=1505723 RepID=A0A1I1QZ22_9LACO|nr:DUF3397 domain-containing protein [Lactobacillus bombicola]MCO6528306.1 DUF3397 domain-containing protein [Lactobacillus sp.]SFD27391.1 Protein of unknown function [Lactobacillus bombicola]
MFLIFGLPLLGLVCAVILNKLFPRAKFRGYDILPFFLICACHLISLKQSKPEFLPYGFFVFFILVIILTIAEAIKNKNIALDKIMREIWDYLTVNTIFWYIGLMFMLI